MHGCAHVCICVRGSPVWVHGPVCKDVGVALCVQELLCDVWVLLSYSVLFVWSLW